MLISASWQRRTPIVHAVRTNDLKLATAVLKSGADLGVNVNVPDEEGRTALHHVVLPLDYARASFENVEMLRVLVEGSR